MKDLPNTTFGRAHLLELNDALRQMDGHVVRRALRDFAIWPLER